MYNQFSKILSVHIQIILIQNKVSWHYWKVLRFYTGYSLLELGFYDFYIIKDFVEILHGVVNNL